VIPCAYYAVLEHGLGAKKFCKIVLIR